jgi:hypothetical protein
MALARKGDHKGSMKELEKIDIAALAKGDPRLAEKIKMLKHKLAEVVAGRGTLNLEIPKTTELSC